MKVLKVGLFQFNKRIALQHKDPILSPIAWGGIASMQDWAAIVECDVDDPSVPHGPVVVSIHDDRDQPISVGGPIGPPTRSQLMQLFGADGPKNPEVPIRLPRFSFPRKGYYAVLATALGHAIPSDPKLLLQVI